MLTKDRTGSEPGPTGTAGAGGQSQLTPKRSAS
ncbi:MAG: hypothetical protein QOF99_5360, partial [Pseudonocardiales bacterium]|nr:hypothetical protein [Pseudonocardiales bacterium]